MRIRDRNRREEESEGDRQAPEGAAAGKWECKNWQGRGRVERACELGRTKAGILGDQLVARKCSTMLHGRCRGNIISEQTE